MHCPSRRFLVLVVALAAIGGSFLSACTSSDHSAGPTTTTAFTIPLPSDGSTLPAITVPPGFVPTDTRGVRLLGLTGKTPPLPPLPVYGGTANLHGTVNGPDGPVAGATVKIERFVGGRSGSITVATGGDGRWAASNILGGQYRVRAWQQPSLAAEGSQVLFLPADRGSMQVDINVTAHDSQRLQTQLAVTRWNVDDSAQVRALLSHTTVNEDGIVVSQGVPAASVKLAANDRDLSIDSDNPTSTSENGLATWKVTCRTEGAHQVTATEGDQSSTVVLPSCGPKPTTPSTVDVPDFAVGKTFKVPYAGILPAGTYTTTNDGCQTSYAVFVDGAWSPDRITETGSSLTLSDPGRDFKAVGSSKPCEYQRSS